MADHDGSRVETAEEDHALDQRLGTHAPRRHLAVPGLRTGESRSLHPQGLGNGLMNGQRLIHRENLTAPVARSALHLNDAVKLSHAAQQHQVDIAELVSVQAVYRPKSLSVK